MPDLTPASIEFLHEKFFGAQDAYSASAGMTTYPRAGTVLCSKSWTTSKDREVHELAPKGAHHGVANLRLSGDWISAELLIGGQRFDKIWKHLGHDGFWYTQGDRTFPGMEHHHIALVVEGSGAVITYDEVEVENFSLEKPKEIYALGHQYTGEEILKRGQSMVRLNYNHPVFALYVKTSKPVSGLTVQLDEYTVDAPFSWNAAKAQWELVFQEIPADGVPNSSALTINFSRPDRMVLHVQHNHDEVSVNTHVVTSQLTRIMTGMAGLAFSK